jgi:hypothetical protein
MYSKRQPHISAPSVDLKETIQHICMSFRALARTSSRMIATLSSSQRKKVTPADQDLQAASSLPPSRRRSEEGKRYQHLDSQQKVTKSMKAGSKVVQVVVRVSNIRVVGPGGVSASRSNNLRNVVPLINKSLATQVFESVDKTPPSSVYIRWLRKNSTQQEQQDHHLPKEEENDDEEETSKESSHPNTVADAHPAASDFEPELLQFKFKEVKEGGISSSFELKRSFPNNSNSPLQRQHLNLNRTNKSPMLPNELVYLTTTAIDQKQSVRTSVRMYCEDYWSDDEL